MEEFKNLERLPDEVRKKYVPYPGEITACYPNEVLSAAIYGSATGINYIPGKSDVNSVIILKEMSFAHLEKVLHGVARGVKRRIAAPLLVTGINMTIILGADLMRQMLMPFLFLVRVSNDILYRRRPYHQTLRQRKQRR